MSIKLTKDTMERTMEKFSVLYDLGKIHPKDHKNRLILTKQDEDLKLFDELLDQDIENENFVLRKYGIIAYLRKRFFNFLSKNL